MHWRELEVWKKSHLLVLETYKVTSTFPTAERYGLIDQIRRASYSVPANIVEGQARHTTKEYLSYLYNARGSVEEVRYFVLLSRELGYIHDDIYQTLESKYETVSKMLNGLIKSLKP
ncbi:MAG: four helix bundle protein [Nitrospirae bacterium]|nr:four helix bundle protein [Nitrospirota bacterium]